MDVDIALPLGNFEGGSLRDTKTKTLVTPFQ